MPAYNTSDIVRTMQEMQQQIYKLENDIKSNHSQLNDRFDALIERLFSQNTTASSPEEGNYIRHVTYSNVPLTFIFI